jgi:O-antigen/teichoic acid export membrane protein
MTTPPRPPDQQVPPDDTDGQPLATRAVRGGLWAMLGAYWMVGFGFLINIALVRLIDDPDVFGTFAGAVMFAQLLNPATLLGLNYAFVNHQELSGESIGTYALLNMLAMVVGVLLMLLVAPLLRTLGYEAIVVQASIAMALVMALTTLSDTFRVMLEKELHFGALSLWQALTFSLSFVPAVWLAWRYGTVWSLISAPLTQHVLALVGTIWLLRRHMPFVWQVRWRFDWVLARHFVRYGVLVGVSFMATALLSHLDDFYILTFAGLTVLGFYDRAYRTAQWPSTLLASLTARLALYTYARLQDDLARLRKTIEMVLWLIMALALPLSLAIFVAAPDMIVLFYGETWLPATIFLRILVIFAVIRPLWENASNLFVAIGRPRLPLVFMLAQVATLAVAGLPLTLLWGALGTCAAVALAYAVGMALIQRDIQREVGLDMARALGLPLLVTLLTAAGYLALVALLPLAEWPLLLRLLVKVGYAFGAFYGLLLLLQPRATRERVTYIWRLARRQPLPGAAAEG